MRDIKIVEGIEYKIERVSVCEGCHFHKPNFSVGVSDTDGGCSFPEELEMDCGKDTVYKKHKAEAE